MAYLFKQAEEPVIWGFLAPDCHGVIGRSRKEPKPDYALGTPSVSVPHCCHSHSSPSNNEQHFHVSISKVTTHVSDT